MYIMSQDRERVISTETIESVRYSRNESAAGEEHLVVANMLSGEEYRLATMPDRTGALGVVERIMCFLCNSDYREEALDLSRPKVGK